MMLLLVRRLEDLAPISGVRVLRDRGLEGTREKIIIRHVYLTGLLSTNIVALAAIYLMQFNVPMLYILRVLRG